MWFPKGPNSGVRVIVNFTQGASAGDKRLTRRLVTYREKWDILVKDLLKGSVLVGHVITFYDSKQSQYAHLGASMLSYAHINPLSMLQRFAEDEAVRAATDIIYLRKSALEKIECMKAFWKGEEGANEPKMWGHYTRSLSPPDYISFPKPVQWWEKDEKLRPGAKHAGYIAKEEFWRNKKDFELSTLPIFGDTSLQTKFRIYQGVEEAQRDREQ